MRTLSCCLTVLVLAAPGLAAGKVREIKRADLPESVKVKAGDTVVVIEDVKPGDVDQVAARSDNPNVTVRAEPRGGKVRIVIEAGKKGEATVVWRYETADGKVTGPTGLKVRVE
jgi:hypothetical protein